MKQHPHKTAIFVCAALRTWHPTHLKQSTATSSENCSQFIIITNPLTLHKRDSWKQRRFVRGVTHEEWRSLYGHNTLPVSDWVGSALARRLSRTSWDPRRVVEYLWEGRQVHGCCACSVGLDLCLLASRATTAVRWGLPSSPAWNSPNAGRGRIPAVLSWRYECVCSGILNTAEVSDEEEIFVWSRN